MPKPKILITGFNAEQSNKDYYLRKELKVIGPFYSLTHCLEDMGYEVEQRPVRQDETLDEYAEVIVFLHSPRAFCHNLYAGLAALVARPDCVVAFDDWQINQILASLKVYHDELCRDDDTAFKQYYFDLFQDKTTSREHIMTRKAEYREALGKILEKRNRLLLTVYKGGDLSRFGLGWQGPVIPYNPNPYHLRRTEANNYGEPGGSALDAFFGEDEHVKSRTWVFSSLVQNKTRPWLAKQGITWPVRIFGARRGQFKSERVTEPEMCRIYRDCWGCLMPGYYHAGGGWWRVRVQQVADAGSIMLCDDEEGKLYGPSFVGLTAKKIESMTDSELRELADRQARELRENHPLDKAVQRQELQVMFDVK